MEFISIEAFSQSLSVSSSASHPCDTNPHKDSQAAVWLKTHSLSYPFCSQWASSLNQTSYHGLGYENPENSIPALKKISCRARSEQWGEMSKARSLVSSGTASIPHLSNYAMLMWEANRKGSQERPDGKSLCYFCIFSVSLKLFQSKKV